ncbi:MAG: anthranilate phosphoribosyltransferase, partial [Candidatus Aenigmarchaeota archaeon]|nr:anthranilate phosphoribosyltransferase [Candidatus Aenigmarchaeota archaeon]
MIKTAINKLTEYQNLTQEETRNVFNQIMEGNATNAQIAAFLIALKMKKETIAEITGAVEVMREKATRIVVERELVVDTCGTGGDKTNTFNISTTAAFIVGGVSGIAVAKHGNKGVSSKCGSADVLCALGVNINADISKTKESIEKANIGFAF